MTQFSWSPSYVELCNVKSGLLVAVKKDVYAANQYFPDLKIISLVDKLFPVTQPPN